MSDLLTVVLRQRPLVEIDGLDPRAIANRRPCGAHAGHQFFDDIQFVEGGPARITAAPSRPGLQPDRESLGEVFSEERLRKGAARAARLLRAHRSALTGSVARELSMERYNVQQILRLLIERCEELHLFVRGSKREALRHSRWMLQRITRFYAQGETPQLPL